MRTLPLILFLALAGCGHDDEPLLDGGSDGGFDASDAELACVRYRFEPDAQDLSSFPNVDAFEADGATVTGFRLAVDASRFPSVADYQTYASLFDELGELDGFGTSAGAFLGFEGDLGPTPEGGPGADPAEVGFGFVVTPSEGAAYLVPAELTVVDEGTTLVLEPTEPLPESTWVGVFVTDAVAPCVLPSAFMDAQRASTDPRVVAVRDALAEAGVAPTSLLALQVYPTQSITPDSIIIAEGIAARPESEFALAFEGCVPVPELGARRCTSTLDAYDYRDEAGVVRGTEPVTPWSLEVQSWLPMETGMGPYTTLFFGHGISVGATVHTPQFVADALAHDVILVSVSAVLHEGHPSAASPLPESFELTLAFFAVDTVSDTVEALRLRDHLRQTVYDRLFVGRALSLGPDLDGDGESDVDVDRLGYLGVSLGAILGTQTVALSDAFSVATLSLPGGRLSQVMTDGGFSLVLQSLIPRELRRGGVERLFVVVQTLIERGDPVNWAVRLQRERLIGQAPDVFLQVAIGDVVVPNTASYSLARALQTPVTPPLLDAAPGLMLSDGLPLSGNRGPVTLALQQYDQVDTPAGLDSASHNNLPTSQLAQTAWYRFFETGWGGPGEVIDPYEALGVGHL